MFETDLSGQPIEVDNLDADWLLAFAEDTDTKERQATRAKLRLAARWCVLHPATADTGAATWADSGLPEALDCDEAIGGEGTPAVAAFAAEPFAASLGISTDAGMALMSDALNLQHRLPRIWAKVESLEVVAWRARRVAQATSTLSRDAALYIDQELADRIETCGAITIDRVIAEAVARFDPEATVEREANARKNWGVRISHGKNTDGFVGTSWIDAAGDTLDLTRFHDYVCQVAEQLRLDGDTDDLDLRKAKALGVIANYADGGTTGAGAAKTKLYLHLTLADLVSTSSTGDATDVGTVEKLGPATVTKIREWAGNSHVTIQPVLDMSRGDSAAPATRGLAISTTSSPTKTRPRADRPAKPAQRISRHCAGVITAARPSAAGDISAYPTAPTSGDHPTTGPTWSPRPPPAPSATTDPQA